MKALPTFTLIAIITLYCASTAKAHFPWLIVNEQGKAALFFGEDLTDRTYKLPPAVKDAKVLWVAEGKTIPLAMQLKESEDFVGLVSGQDVQGTGQLHSEITYGIYNGSRLNYRAIHQSGTMPTELQSTTAADAETNGIAAQLIDTDAGVDVIVTWNGKPLKGAKVSLYCDEGHEEGNAETDVDGRVSFSDNEVESGINAVLFGHTVQEAGELDGQTYKTSMNYVSFTFAR